jgi:antitoxin component HigA of HigAB toxin-antitoxin module
MATEKYKALIDRLALAPIKSDGQLDEAHEVAQSLMLRELPLAPEEEDYLEVLLDEIAKYEQKHHFLKIQDMTPLELLLSFMQDHELKQIEVAKILGVSSGVANEVVKGKRELTKEQCVKLGHHFKVTPAAFLPKIFA